MKYVVILCSLLFCLAQGIILPDQISNLLCPRDENLTQCVKDNLPKAVDLFVRGIPELNFPSIDPLEVPFASVDRTINELVSIKAVMRNIRAVGLKDTILDDIKMDVATQSGELRITMPWINLEMDYDVTGQLLAIPLRSRGHFNGNFTDTQIFIKSNVRNYTKENGKQYYKIDKFYFKSRVGDGHIALTAANPDLQFAADLISNFYNENPREVMDAINPIYVEYASELFRVVLDQTFGSIPAEDWFPK